MCSGYNHHLHNKAVMADKRIGFSIEITGTDGQARRLSKIEAELRRITKARNELVKKQSEGNTLSKEEQRTLAKLTREQSKLRQQKADTTKEIKRQNKEIKSVAGSYNRLVAENAKLRKTMNALPLNDTTGKLDKLQKQFAKNTAKLKAFDAKVGQNFRNVGNYGSALNGVRQNFASLAVGITGAIVVLNQIQRVFGSTVDVITNFEQSTANLAGVLDKTTEEIKPLTDDAIRLGSVTAKTATEITGLQESFARLGFEQEEIIDLTEATIDGSIAMRGELSATAEVVGAIVNSFDDLSTTDAPNVIDVLTKATQKSALNFTKLQTALPIVSGAANAADIPFTKLVALLGKLSDAGIDASSSSTALRNIFIESAKQGLSYEQILEKIKGSQDKLTAANDEFGKRAAVSASILANNIEKIDELDESLNDAGGTAQRVADTQLSTLEGELTLLTSAWEGLILSIDRGDGVISKAGKTIVESLTKTVTELTRLSRNGIETRSELDESFTTSAVDQARKRTEELAKQGATAVDEEIALTKARIARLTELQDSEDVRQRVVAKRAISANRLLLQELNSLTDAEIEAAQASIDLSNSLGSSSFGGKDAPETARSIAVINAELKEQREIFEGSAIGSKLFAESQTKIIFLQKELEDATGKTAKALAKADEEIKKFGQSIRDSIVFDDIDLGEAFFGEDAIEVDLAEQFFPEEQIDEMKQRQEDLLLTSYFETLEGREAFLKALLDRQLITQNQFNIEMMKLDAERIASLEAQQKKAADIATSIGRRVGDIIGDNNLTIEQKQTELFKTLVISGLKLVKQQALLAATSATVGSLASPQSIASGGAAGAIQAGVLVGLIEAAFAALEASVSTSFARGGVLKGASHRAGGINLGGGNEAEGNEIVLTKGVYANPGLRSIASDLNVAGGGKKFASGGVITSANIAPSASSLSNLQQVSSREIARELGAVVNDKRVFVTEEDISGTQATVEENESIGLF